MPLNLPERASYEFLKKLAKDRLASLRATNPTANLAAAQLVVGTRVRILQLARVEDGDRPPPSAAHRRVHTCVHSR